ncbi:MAG: virulence RhuM family protein [Bacilli bacterium]|nr:virulence RhuM family protein [Bacilli bacterium]
MLDYEIVKFKDNSIEIDVNVSPSEETVWLSLNDICALFGRDKSVISRHIRNVLLENDLDVNQVVAKNATTGNDGKTYVVSFYNLEVIIPVGYKVHSRNGILFRRWANNVLKEYLLKGYVIDEKRTLITNENYINLINKVDSIDKRLANLEKIDAEKEKIFFDGEMFDAKSFISRLISKANSSIILIDAYADVKALDFLKYKKQGVVLSIYHSSKAKLTASDIYDFNAQYGMCSSFVSDKFHDRFLIIDGKEIYHLGASLNYAGKKVFAITRMEDLEILESIKRNL